MVTCGFAHDSYSVLPYSAVVLGCRLIRYLMNPVISIKPATLAISLNYSPQWTSSEPWIRILLHQESNAASPWCDSDAICAVLAAALNQGVNLRRSAESSLSNMWGNGRCGCNTATLHVDGLIFKDARVSPCSLHCARRAYLSVRYMAPPSPVGGILWSRSLSWGNCLRKEQEKRRWTQTILEASNNSFWLAFGALFQSSLTYLRIALSTAEQGCYSPTTPDMRGKEHNW